MSHFELADAFDIDNNELSSVSREQAFVLGVEWAMFRDELLHNKREIVSAVNSGNTQRLKELCRRHNRTAESERLCHGWDKLIVSDKPMLRLVKQGAHSNA